MGLKPSVNCNISSAMFLSMKINRKKNHQPGPTDGINHRDYPLFTETKNVNNKPDK